MKAMDTIYMRKKGSPVMIKIYQDEDPLFCNAELIKVKTREIKARHYFLRTDLNQFTPMYRRDGFVPVDMNAVQVAPQKKETTG